MPAIVTTILSALQLAAQYGPGAIQSVESLYNAVKSDISETDQQKIDAALAQAIADDAASTAAADAALDAASKR